MEAFISELTEGGFMRVIQYKEFCTQALDIWDYVAEGMSPQKKLTGTKLYQEGANTPRSHLMKFYILAISFGILVFSCMTIKNYKGIN